MESKGEGGGDNQAVPSTLKDRVDSPTPTDSCPPFPASDETTAQGCLSGSVGKRLPGTQCLSLSTTQTRYGGARI